MAAAWRAIAPATQVRVANCNNFSESREHIIGTCYPGGVPVVDACDRIECGDSFCLETEHAWGENDANTLVSAVCTSEACTDNSNCAVGLRCSVDGRCEFGGFCGGNDDCDGTEICAFQSGMGGGQNCLVQDRLAPHCTDDEVNIAGFCVEPHAQVVACGVGKQSVRGACQTP